ncbi:MAG: c-type cytochrome biogenesis protein CcmI [Paracoccaceae bacterium]|nr:MAG: c-type cytochrome biogenesis protein CcmI [Paracoccaceae bacterium]
MPWIAFAALTGATLLWILWPLIRPGGQAARRAAHDRQIYRDQLAEIDRDLARGVLDAAEAEAARAEVARRLLAADAAAARESGPAATPPRLRWFAAGLVAVAVAGGTTGLYLWRGAPTLPDAPLAERRAARPTQAEHEARLAEAGIDPAPPARGEDVRLAELVGQLREVLAGRPQDIRGHRLLVGALARLGHYAEAHRVQAHVLELLGDSATAGDHADHAELMILAARGYVSPEAEAALARALERDPALKPARYYAGLALAQQGRAEEAFSLWSALLAEGPEDAPWIAPIREQIGALAAALGRTPPPPATPGPGPSAEDVAAAAQMSPEARQEMIRGMVEGLAERLSREGGPAADWARLIRALGVLGERERAGKVWAEARTAFADRPDDLALLRAAADAAGLAE